MNELVVVAAVSTVVLVVVLTELAAAAVPLLIVVTLVPPHERAELATLLAACDNSRRLRLSSAMRVAVMARRQQRANRVDAPERPGPLTAPAAGGVWHLNSPRVPAEHVRSNRR
jgi:hypothetical protein